MAPVLGQGFIVSSLEQYNYQVGDATVNLRSYDGFDEIDGFEDVTGLSLSINGQSPENIPFDTFYDAFKRGINYDTLNSMLAERPINATYTHNLTGSPSGSVTITAPGIPYANARPVNPIFTVSGVTGTWVIGPEGEGRFYFDPTTTNSFTVTMNAYAATTQGSHYAYAAFVSDITNGFESIDAYSSDIVEAGEASPVPNQLTFTFTKGLGLDAGDAAPSTYGFGAGTRFEIEGEHVNIFGLSDAGLGEGIAFKAFVYQTVTAFQLVAVADPLSDFPIATEVEVIHTSSGANAFTLTWQTTPADAPVDVYRSGNLVSWGNPVSEINLSGTYTEAIAPGSKGFFVVVPSGSLYPPPP